MPKVVVSVSDFCGYEARIGGEFGSFLFRVEISKNGLVLLSRNPKDPRSEFFLVKGKWSKWPPSFLEVIVQIWERLSKGEQTLLNDFREVSRIQVLWSGESFDIREQRAETIAQMVKSDFRESLIVQGRWFKGSSSSLRGNSGWELFDSQHFIVLLNAKRFLAKPEIEIPTILYQGWRSALCGGPETLESLYRLLVSPETWVEYVEYEKENSLRGSCPKAI